MSEIRTFRNSDLPALVAVLNEHHARLGKPLAVRQCQFEQALLSRRFFNRDSLLIAVDDSDEPVGWSHCFTRVATESISLSEQGKTNHSAAQDACTIAAICLGDAIDLVIATKLVTAVKSHLMAASMDSSKIQVGLVRDSCFGYAGLAPFGFGYGVDVLDQQTSSLLESTGFVRHRRYLQLVADTTAYRAPVSREALQFRRISSTRVEPLLVSDQRRAVALSHLNVDRHQLIQRSGALLAELDVWSSDPEAEVMSPSRVIIELTSSSPQYSDAANSYLLATVLSELGRRGILHAETVVAEVETETHQMLQKHGFETAAQGEQWQITAD